MVPIIEPIPNRKSLLASVVINTLYSVEAHNTKMTRLHLHQPSLPFHDLLINSTSDQAEQNDLSLYGYMGTNDETPLKLPSMMEDLYMDLEEIEPNLVELDGDLEYFEGQEGSFPSQQLSSEGDGWSPSMSIHSSLTLPYENMEIDKQLSLGHLLMAYGEAMEKGQEELAGVILKCASEEVSPVGNTLERLAFYLSLDFQSQGDYFKQEALNNLENAFKAFYQVYPHGRFAHFSANSAILEAIPDDADGIHIVDFDMGEGVQWPPIIEAIAKRQKILKLTSIRWEKYSECGYSPRRFEEIKGQLYEHAKSCRLTLMVEEKGIEDVKNELKKIVGKPREWLVFNCMIGLPHMRRGRSRGHAMEFVKLAKDSTAGCRGLITIGDGEACETLKSCLNFRSFFHGQETHYRALLESIEMGLPVRLAEANTAMECLFVAPYINGHAWLQKWEEIRKGRHLHSGVGLQGRTLRKEVLMEALEMVKDKKSYESRIDGPNGNEIVLEWRGCPLMRVSTFNLGSLV